MFLKTLLVTESHFCRLFQSQIGRHFLPVDLEGEYTEWLRLVSRTAVVVFQEAHFTHVLPSEAHSDYVEYSGNEEI